MSIAFNGCITINSVFLCTESRDNITKILHFDTPLYSIIAPQQMLYFFAKHLVKALHKYSFCVPDVFNGWRTIHVIFCAHHPVMALKYSISLSSVFTCSITINDIFLCTTSSNDITKYCISVSIVLNDYISINAACLCKKHPDMTF